MSKTFEDLESHLAKFDGLVFHVVWKSQLLKCEPSCYYSSNDDFFRMVQKASSSKSCFMHGFVLFRMVHNKGSTESPEIATSTEDLLKFLKWWMNKFT